MLSFGPAREPVTETAIGTTPAPQDVKPATPPQARARDPFLAMVAHEMNNSLTVLHAEIGLLKEDARESVPVNEQTAERLLSYVERLTRLARDLAEAGRRRTSGFGLERSEIDLSDVVAKEAAAREAAAESSGVRLDTLMAGNVRVNADGQRVAQVVSNLLANALRFTPAGGDVSVSVLDSDAAVTVTVSNSGRSLSREQLDRLFQAFSQVHDEPRLRKGGLGLGLFISRGIVEAHGGRIWCESEPGRVAFSFTLPKSASSSGDVARAR